jgi:hypothetical protein
MFAHARVARRGLGLSELATPTMRLFGVSDGIRTHDIQDHNLALCQLSYAHHGRAGARGGCVQHTGIRSPVRTGICLARLG